MAVKKQPAGAKDARDASSVPGLGRSPGEGNDNALQYSCLENPMDRGAWQAIVHGVAKSRTRLSDWSHYTQALRKKKKPGLVSTATASVHRAVQGARGPENARRAAGTGEVLPSTQRVCECGSWKRKTREKILRNMA